MTVLTPEQSERLWRTLLELWCDQYGVDVQLVSIAHTDEPTQIIIKED